MLRAARTWGVFWNESKLPDLFGVILPIKQKTSIGVQNPPPGFSANVHSDKEYFKSQ